MRRRRNSKASQGKPQDPPSNLGRLYQAIKEGHKTNRDCATVEAGLPRYVDDEMAGEDVTTKHLDIKRHLDLCAHCELLYGELLALALAEQADRLPTLAGAPKPDLSFLPPLPAFAKLARQLVTTVAQKALRRLAPEALPDWSALSDAFFQPLDALDGLLPAQCAAALDLGEAPTTMTLATLTTAYLTTQQIAKTFSVAEVQGQIAQDTWHATLLQTAQRGAQANGLKTAAAQGFAQIYADEALQITDTWFALIERSRV